MAGKGSGRAAQSATSGAEALVAQLEALEVEIVFGIPGVHNLAIFDALRRSQIRPILVRHEQTCVYAADGYARASGKLGVALTTTGPGAANTVAAMGEARASRSPVLHIATQVESRILEGRSGRFSLHESPHQSEMMQAVSVWSATVARAEAIPSMALTAARAAFSGRRGPAFFDIPFDYLDARVPSRPQRLSGARPFRPDPAMVERAVVALGKARTPAIWAGGGAVSAGAAPLVARAAEVLDAPVVTTFAGKGVLPREHPLLVGLPPHQPEVTALLAASDCLLAIGSDLDGMNTQGWRLPLPRPRIALNAVAEDARRNYACDVIVEGDAADALEMVLASLTGEAHDGRRRTERARRGAQSSLRRRAEFRAPYAFVEAMERAVPPDAIVVADMAIPGYWLAGYFRPAGPRRFAYPLGWGTLGFALPAGVGAAAAGVRTLVVTGDAGAMYAPGELGTLAQERLPICVLVVNDGGYGMLRFDEQERFRTTFSTELAMPDFVAFARSFGIRARRSTLDTVERDVRWGLTRDEPTLIELQSAFAPPLTTSPRWPLKAQQEARP